MPFIRTTTNKTLDAKKKTELKELYGKLIEKLPGKSEQWLMLAVEDGKYMAFRGDEAPCAMVEVDLLGSASGTAKDAMTEAVCDKVGELLGIPSERIYVKYMEFSVWGNNGFNF